MGGRAVRVVVLVVLAAAVPLWSPAGGILAGTSAGALAAADDPDDLDPKDRVSPAELPALDAPGRRSDLRPDSRLVEKAVSEPSPRPVPVKLDVERPPVPDFSKVDQERSSGSQLVWETSPGSFVAETAVVPKWFKGGDGRWSAIDVSVAPVEEAPGVLRTRAGEWSATFAPLGAGSGGVSVLAANGDVLSWRPSKVVSSVSPEASDDGLTVTYREVWPGVDLRYRLSSLGVREEMVISSPVAFASFSFDVDQRLVRDLGAEADAAKMDAWPEVQRRLNRYAPAGVEGIKLGAPKVMTGAGVDLFDAPVSSVAVDERQGSVWTVGVDEGWVKQQPKEAFPLILDPDVVFTSVGVNAVKWLTMRNGAFHCGNNYPGVSMFCWALTGNSWYGTDVLWRTVGEYDTAALLGDEPGVSKTVGDAAFLFNRFDGVSSTQTVRVLAANDWTWFGGMPTHLADVPFESFGGVGGLQNWVNRNSSSMFIFTGYEPSGVVNYKVFAASFYVAWSENYTPVITNVSVPPVVAGSWTEMSADVWDGDTDQLLYTWEISTSPGFEPGTLVDSKTTG